MRFVRFMRNLQAILSHGRRAVDHMRVDKDTWFLRQRQGKRTGIPKPSAQREGPLSGVCGLLAKTSAFGPKGNPPKPDTGEPEAKQDQTVRQEHPQLRAVGEE